MNNKLRLIFDKTYSETSFRYYVRIRVDPTITNNTRLQNPLVITKPVNPSGEEQLVRIMTREEYSLNTLPIAPPLSAIFSSEDRGDFEVMESYIRFDSVPESWVLFAGIASTPQVFPMELIDPDEPSLVVLAIPGVPCKAGLSFSVFSYDPTEEELEPPTFVGYDGVMTRDFSAYPAVSLFRTNDVIVYYNTITAAEDAIKSLEAQAQGLIDAINTNTFTGTEVKDFV